MHKLMGSHLSKRIYEACVESEVKLRNYHAERQMLVDIYYKGKKRDDQFGLDMLVENKVILEFKTVPDLDDSHIKQALSCLEVTVYEVGYPVNVSRPRLQFRRFVLEKDRKKYKPNRTV